MDQKERQRTQLECLYDMFRDRIEENVIYIVYSENEGQIEPTIDQLMSISACSLTGHYFEPPKFLLQDVQTETCTLPGQRSQSPNLNNGLPSPTSMTTIKAIDDEFKPVRRSKKVQSCQSKRRKEVRRNGCENQLMTGDADSSVGTSDNTERESIEDEEMDENDQDEEQLDLEERIISLQASIENLLTEKGTCHDKACHYLNKKMFPVTSYYAELASQYRKTIEIKTRKLVDLLLMKSEHANTIDLHGLNPIQAKLVVTELLNSRQDKLSIDKQGEASVDIITGWGKHTVAEGNHRIRPTIVALLREKGYEYYHLNKGALRVTLRR